MKTYGQVTSVVDDHRAKISSEIELLPNYPNPFNSATQIRFSLSRSERVRLAVFDILGRELDTIINRYMEPGFHVINWNAEDKSSGLYFIQLKAGSMIKTLKTVLVQ